MIMPSSNNNKSLSEFGRVAVELDNDFQDFERLSEELERVSLDTDKGLDRSKQLLVKFSDCGQRIATNVRDLAKFLDESRSRAEKSAALVSSKALQIQARQ